MKVVLYSYDTYDRAPRRAGRGTQGGGRGRAPLGSADAGACRGGVRRAAQIAGTCARQRAADHRAGPGVAGPAGPVTVYLDLAALLDLAELILGQPPAVRDMGLLSSAAARPATVAFGVEAYEDLWTKAGALLQSLVLNHALIDGNK